MDLHYPLINSNLWMNTIWGGVAGAMEGVGRGGGGVPLSETVFLSETYEAEPPPPLLSALPWS